LSTQDPFATPEFELHFKPLLQGILDGRVTPFLGAGVNLSDRPDQFKWTTGQGSYLPNGAELAEHLGMILGGPDSGSSDLVRAAQFAALIAGDAALYDELHKAFNADYPPTSVHRFFAGLPALLRSKGYQPRYLVHITTNYDDVLERAFQLADEPYDTLVYLADGDDRGKFVHIPPEGSARLIERPNEYSEVSLDRRSVILKIHGAVERNQAIDGRVWSRETNAGDSFVITEDHYIDYLTRTDISALLPVFVAAKLKKSHFLFLGYGLRDWNLRVILHRITGAQRLAYSSWAIQRSPDQLDEKFWGRRAVTIIDCELRAYIDALRDRLTGVPAK
jgi:SIR2-like domain